MPIVFFHQNDERGVQGGIERYVATLLREAGTNGFVVTERAQAAPSADSVNRVGVPLTWRAGGAKWLSFVLAVILDARQIRRLIERIGPCTLEFSRPEYALFSWMFRGAKVFTIHGTGPSPSERAKYWIHRLACRLLPFAADAVQIVGRDSSGVPKRTLARLSGRIRHVDAWYDDVFRASPLPDTSGPLRVFFAGRLAPMKNPDLLFAIVETATERSPHDFEFRYFGSDGAMIPDGLKHRLRDHGLLDAPQLAGAIAECHVGILCSGYGEGSPFIIVEALACGRGYVLPPLPGLLDAYGGYRGIAFADGYTPGAFIEKLAETRTAFRSGLSAETIAQQVASRNRQTAARSILESLERDRTSRERLV